jgi:hypothetical protein
MNDANHLFQCLQKKKCRFLPSPIIPECLLNVPPPLMI